MLWPKASPLDLDFRLCAWAKLFNYPDKLMFPICKVLSSSILVYIFTNDCFSFTTEFIALSIGGIDTQSGICQCVQQRELVVLANLSF